MNPRLRGVGVAVGVLGVALAITAGASTISPPVATGPASTALHTTLGDPSLACPGPETLQAPKGGSATAPGGAVVVSSVLASSTAATGTIRVGGEASTLAAGAAKNLPGGSPTPTAGMSAKLSVADGGRADGGRADVAALAVAGLGPVSVQAASERSAQTSDQLPLLGATQSTLARTGDLRGLSSVGCDAASTDSWLVGGGTRPGERLRLLLSNPAATAAVVDVQVFGPKGKVDAPAGDGVAVPAHGQTPLYIDALVPGLPQVVVHVTARTGRVRAVMQDSLLRGLTAGGVDDITGGEGPARAQLVPGISLVNAYGSSADDPAASGSTSVRVLVPGSAEAVVRISLLGADGQVQLPAHAVQNVHAGAVVDIPIAGVPSGTYTALVQADVPVVAGARIGRRSTVDGGAGGEFGWARSGSALSGVGLVVLPAGVRSTLSLAARDAAGSFRLTPIAADGTLGSAKTVQVAAGHGATVQLAGGMVAARLSDFSGGPVVGAVVALADDPRGELISLLPVDVARSDRTTSQAAHSDRLGLS